MKRDLKTRLRRYHDAGKTPQAPEANRPKTNCSWPGWKEAGFNTLKREISFVPKTQDLRKPWPGAGASFPGSLAILVPDLLRRNNLHARERIPSPGDLLFFDLETTGLSGGAGTIAFLAAFGRFAGHENYGGKEPPLVITQYLLLDYPGEADFIEKAAAEIKSREFSQRPLLVSYNGKCFDSQILRTRCLMNGINLPEYFHADLLHPARRLWKRRLPDCSQTTIEVSVLGLDRTGDVSGAMAPEIWFSFLRSGENSELLSVCDHNVKDIGGMASLFLTLAEIASDPIESQKRFRFDEEALALSWNHILKKNHGFFGEGESDMYAKTGNILLENAARNGSPRAALVMAKNAEWRLKDITRALEYTNAALTLRDLPGNLREDLEKRRARLEGKLG